MEKVHRIGFTQLSHTNTPDKPCKVNVVFIHGLRGHPERTWTSGDEAGGEPQPPKSRRQRLSNMLHWKEAISSDDSESRGEAPRGQVFWPRDFLVRDLPDARIWTYGYNADVIGGLFQSNNQNSISQHGRDLATKIKRDIEYKEPIVFVAHSLGGLLIKDALSRSEGLHLRTNFILFLGTPHRGSSYAEWGQIAVNLASLALQDSNSNILRGLEVNGEVLDSIHERFTNIVAESKIKIYSFQEARGVSGMKGLHNKVVDDFSSKLGLPSELETVQSIDANHTEMVKCKSRGDPQYRDILSVLRHIIRHVPLGTVRLASEASCSSPFHLSTLEQETVPETGKATDTSSNVQRHRDRCNSLLRRLYTLPYEDRKDRNPKRVKGTCEWFTSHLLFQGWQEEQSSALLWVSADPGCGKSVLARYLVDEMLQSSNNVPNAVCYFFFKDDFKDQRNTEDALCCILHQIFTQRPALLSDNILDEFDSKGDNIFTSFSNLWGIFVKVAGDRNAERVVCVLDALDECEVGGRCRLIEAVCELYDPKADVLSSSIKLLLTSRPYGCIQREFQTLENRLPTIHLSGENEAEVEKICQEIDLVIGDKVNNLSERLLLSQEEQQLLKDELTRIPHRTYLWVYLIFDVIKDILYITEDDLRTSIRKLPKTVEAAYDKILCRSHNQEQAKRLLHIVVAAERPLSLKEMALALAIRENHQTYANLRLQGEDQFRRTVRELCGLFVTIVDSKVYLLHQTAKEFLVKGQALDKPVHSDPEPNTLQWRFSLEPTESHLILAEICIWHLLFKDFETFPLKDECRVFLDYSATHWSTHLQQAEIDEDAPIQRFIIQLFRTTPERETTWRVIYNIRPRYIFPRHFWALGWASYLGLTKVVRLLLKDAAGVNPDRTSPPNVEDNGSAVHWAVRGGNRAVVQMLLDNGADIEAKDEMLSTPLFEAVYRNHEDVIRFLLENGADINARNGNGQTALQVAADRGYGTIVDLLLQKGAGPESMNEFCWGLLVWAIQREREDLVRLLLYRNGCNIKDGDENEYTALCSAAILGSKDRMRLLLEQGANVNATRGNSFTALLCSCVRSILDSEHEDIVRLLLSHGANTEAEDEYGRTILSLLVGVPNTERIVRILLSKGANIEARYKNGETPLLRAVYWGQVPMIRLLLEEGADVNARDNDGTTALWLATHDLYPMPFNVQESAIIQLLRQNGAVEC
ncbi:hypothetical protein F4776DRAFT_661226 [Hypoxylon sp. NC0597]|nr:hypothetical protein F4776DRAFT_661226 [Hypoxylon sp. NC0597]